MISRLIEFNLDATLELTAAVLLLLAVTTCDSECGRFGIDRSCTGDEGCELGMISSDD